MCCPDLEKQRLHTASEEFSFQLGQQPGTDTLTTTVPGNTDFQYLGLRVAPSAAAPADYRPPHRCDQCCPIPGRQFLDDLAFPPR